MSQRKSNVINIGTKFKSRVQVVASCERIGVRATAINTGLAERTLRSWNERHVAFGVDGLRDKSRAPHYVWNKKDREGKAAQALGRLIKDGLGLNGLQVFTRLLFSDIEMIPTPSWKGKE